MYLKFAWRYFKSKKSTNAINIIARVALGVIIFATCCQLLVLSVYNGFESIVLDSYSAFYSEIKITPQKGKAFEINDSIVEVLKKQPEVTKTAKVLEEKALLQHQDFQTVIIVKAVDTSYSKNTLVPQKIIDGTFELGDSSLAKLVVGAGVQNALGLKTASDPFGPSRVVMIMPKNVPNSSDPLAAISETEASVSGAFSIQIEFDSKYVFTNLAALQNQLGVGQNVVGGIEVSLADNANIEKVKKELQEKLGSKFKVLSKFEQNTSLYQTLQLEKWAIYAVLTLILIIAAFNIVSSLTMLVIEKQKDISLLKSIGASNGFITKIFFSEGFLLGVLGAIFGLLLALVISLLQNKFQFIPINGETFAVDYFPVKIVLRDVLLVACTSIGIACIAAFFPAIRAAKKSISLK